MSDIKITYGRRFIGIEINPEYCKVVEERLKLTKRDNKQLIIV